MVYIDDILIFLDSVSDHVIHIRKVLEAIQRSGLRLRKDKCVWGKRQVEFLGHVVGNGVLAIPGHRVEAMKNFVCPIFQE